MLPKMLNVGAEDSGMFYDYDTDQFLEPMADSEDTQPVIVSPIEDEVELPPQAAQDMRSPFLEGLSQTAYTTINYIADGSVETVEHTPTPVHPALSGPLKRRI
jgi:hypothetical protein